MGHLIRLRYDQTQSVEFDHPLFDLADEYKLTDEEYSKAKKNERQLSKLWLVRRLIGRYLYHWPITHTWRDDMCSAALEGLCEAEDLDEKPLLNVLQNRIESTLNDIQAIVRGSLGTNKSRAAENRELEYADSIPITNNFGSEDPDLKLAELLEQLTPEERAEYEKYRETSET